MSMFFLEPLLVYVVFLLFVAGNSSLIVSCSFFKLLFSYRIWCLLFLFQYDSAFLCNSCANNSSFGFNPVMLNSKLPIDMITI
jgi:hypothetical protein